MRPQARPGPFSRHITFCQQLQAVGLTEAQLHNGSQSFPSVLTELEIRTCVRARPGPLEMGRKRRGTRGGVRESMVGPRAMGEAFAPPARRATGEVACTCLRNGLAPAGAPPWTLRPPETGADSQGGLESPFADARTGRRGDVAEPSGEAAGVCRTSCSLTASHLGRQQALFAPSLVPTPTDDLYLPGPLLFSFSVAPN